MKNNKHFLHFVVSVCAIFLCVACNGGNVGPGPSPDPDPPTPPDPPVPVESVTTLKAKDIMPGCVISFQYKGEGDCVVDWGDGTSTSNENHDAYHTYSQSFEDITITITGMVTEINLYNPYFYFDNALINSIELGNSITTIPDHAFSSCLLTEAIIPDSVTTVGGYVFGSDLGDLLVYCGAESQPSGWNQNWNNYDYYCCWGFISKGEDNDTYNYVVTKKGIGIIRYKKNEEVIEIPSELEGTPVSAIYDRAFKGCNATTKIVVPSGITSIGDEAFYGCDHMLEVNIPSSVTTMGKNVFLWCIKTIIYCEAENQPEGWDESWNVEKRPCYWGCISEGSDGNFEYVITTNGVVISKYIGEDETVELRESFQEKPVTTIGAEAFGGKENLKAVTIPDSITSIDDKAFDNCKNMSEIIIPSSVTTMGKNVFSWCTNVIIYCKSEEQPEGWDEEWNADDRPCYWGYLDKDADENFKYIITTAGVIIDKYIGSNTGIEVVIPSVYKESPVTTINAEAFYSKGELEGVTIPDSIVTIGKNAFSWCGKIIIYCEAAEQPTGWDEEWNPNKRPCYWGFISKENDENFKYITTTEGVYVTNYIGTDAEVVIPATHHERPVTTVDYRAFYSLRTLTKITLPNGIIRIGEEAFCDCIAVMELNIPNSVTTIEKNAFLFWGNNDSIIDLTDFTDPSGELPSVGEDAFVVANGKFKVTSIEMRAAFIAKDGWPDDEDKYIVATP